MWVKLQNTVGNRNGQAFVEFMLLVPVLMVFILFAVEMSQLFTQAQNAITLSREIANASFRDCSDLQGQLRNDCLAGITDQIETGAQNILPGFNARGTVIAQVFVQDPEIEDQPAPQLAAAVTRGGGGFESIYTTETIDQNLLFREGTLVLGILAYRYQRITPIGGLLDWLNFPSEIYATTIF